MKISVEPIGYVRNSRAVPDDDYWGGIESRLVIDDSLGEECLDGIEAFSHAEVIFHFHLVGEDRVEHGARHPRDNPAWPKVGIFAQRGKNRPNRLGLSTVRILGREGRTLVVAGLDAVDGTPVLDIKPVMAEFMPAGEIVQPEWAGELMRYYWKTRQGTRPDPGPS